MIYITASELANSPGARELAQVATAAHIVVVSDELMEATLRGADRGAWTVAEVAAADDALERISGAVEQAESLIDGFLVQRGYTVPLDPVQKLVTGWTRSITRYFLHKDRLSDDGSDPIVRNYNDAIKLLKLIVAGQFSLGGNDSIKESADALDVQFEYDDKVFGRSELKSFR